MNAVDLVSKIFRGRLSEPKGKPSVGKAGTTRPLAKESENTRVPEVKMRIVNVRRSGVAG